VRMSLRVSKIPTRSWRWFLEDMDEIGVPVIEESADFPTWPAAAAAARAAHPEVDRLFIHAVRGYGTAYEDSL
jgi:hypothetical protein